MTSTIEREDIVPVPVACRGIQDQVTATERLSAKLAMILATAPPERRASLQARIDELDDRLAALGVRLRDCVESNTQREPPQPPAEPLPEITVRKRDIDREIYLAIAATADAETDIVAGILDRLVTARPGLSAARLMQASEAVATAMAANRPDPTTDLSPNEAFRMSRILAAVVPELSDPLLRDAAADYARAFLGSFRAGAAQRRQIQPLDLQFDRLAGVEQFRRDVWRRLHEVASKRPAVANAIDSGPLGAALDVATTDGAAEAVAKVQIPSLRQLVDGHIRTDGSLVMPSGEIERTLDELASQVGGLRDSYTVNLIEINVAIGTAEDKAKSGATTSELEAAIAKAEAKQKELDKVLKGAASGVKSTFGALAAIADLADAEFGGDLREFAEISVGMLNAVSAASDAGIQVAKAVAGIASASASQLLLGGGIGFAFVMVALMIQVSGLFGKSRSKPINQVILEEIRKLAEQVAELRDEMRARFDQLDRRLDRMYVGILTRLAEIDFNIGQVNGDVQELQASLYQLHTELTRLTADLQALLDAAHRRDLIEAINGFLNFAERTGQPLDADGFREAENIFYSWGNDHAKDALQAGPEQRAFTDDDLLTELTSLGVTTNVNYLRMVPAEKFGLPVLAANRLPNPLDWIVAGEAYAQLSEESPQLAGQISAARVQDLIDIGEVLGEGLSRIADPALFGALAEHYRTMLEGLSQQITAFEAVFTVDPDHGLQDIDPWGGAEQEPRSHFFTTSFDELKRCGGGRFDDATSVLSASPVADLDLAALFPFLIADNLSRSELPGVADGLSRLSACVAASWRQVGFEDPGFGGLVFITYALTITVNFNFGDDVVYRYRADTNEKFRASVRKADVDTFDPATSPGGKNPYPLLVGEKKLWDKLSTFDRSQRFVDDRVRPAVVATVQAKLRLVQREFYRAVATRLGQAGDPIGQHGARLTGSTQLWQAMVLSGLPLSIQANEILRSLVFGGNALLGGTDRDVEDLLLDDFQDLYTLFAGRDKDPPPANILGDIRELALDRLGRLVDLLDGIVENGNPAEPPQVLAPTLLRLGLLV
jgi:cell division septum initiation protein DivIVA